MKSYNQDGERGLRRTISDDGDSHNSTKIVAQGKYCLKLPGLYTCNNSLQLAGAAGEIWPASRPTHRESAAN